jgi:hypothetical protein
VDIALNETTSFAVRRFRCSKCYGAWLEWDEVLRQFEANSLSSAKQVFESVDRDDELRCPHGECNRAMRALIVGDDVEIDFCTSHGFWFDRGELSRSLAAAGDSAAALDLDEEPPALQATLERLRAAPAVRDCGVCAASAALCGMCAGTVCTLHLVAGMCRDCAVQLVLNQ